MTTAHDQQLESVLSLPDDMPQRILEMALVRQLTTCEIATRLGISEMEAETQYALALATAQLKRRQDIDGALLTWEARSHSGKARYGDISVGLVKPPAVGIDRMRVLDYLPGRRTEVRCSGERTRQMSPTEITRVKAWLAAMATQLRTALDSLLSRDDPPMSAPMPLTGWPPLE